MSDKGRLHQINATYLPEEDRILLRLTTTDGAEYKCWLTRRYLALLWQVTRQVAERLGGAGMPAALLADAALRAELTRQAHNPLTSGIDTKTEFTAGSRFPLGSEPLLLSRITHRPRAPGQQQLRLEPASGEGIDIVLDEKLAHTLLRILGDAAQRADWGLDLKIVKAPDAPEMPRPERLH